MKGLTMETTEENDQLFKVNHLDWDRITIATNIDEVKTQQWDTFEKLAEVYEGINISFRELLQIPILLFEIESMILCDGMRDTRLSDLNHSEVESLAFEMFLKVGITRSQHGGCGYMEMGECANRVIEKHLSEKKHREPGTESLMHNTKEWLENNGIDLLPKWK